MAALFTVHRGEPELVKPATATPQESKPLSDIDDQEGMRFYSSGIHLYRADPSRSHLDPAEVIKDALSRALVHYYPLAGRLREEPGSRKLVVDCNAEGVLFVEADADAVADDFAGVQGPPFPSFESFIYDCHADMGVETVIGVPLLYIQVTRLRCGGFIFGQRFCHCVVDAPGGMQFEKAIGELARGAAQPSVAPVWAREIFTARDPPSPAFPHLEYVEPAGSAGPERLVTTPKSDMVRIPFFFGPREIAALRRHMPERTAYSRFDLIAACIWRSRTAALGYAEDDEVRVSIIVNARGRVPMPEGFYGNAFAYSAAAEKAGRLTGSPLWHAAELVKKAKVSAMTQEHLQSVADLMVLRGRPMFAVQRTYFISDISRVGFKDVDFGWGPAVYGGPAKGGEGPILGATNYFSAYRNDKGEEGTMVPICLPKDAMETFLLHLHTLFSISDSD